jgi:acyl transferase domain-containing protein
MPNLHRRTTEAGLADDFRPGVELGEASVDLSNEFERQFFGDLMLFSTEELVRRADVSQPFDQQLIEAIVGEKEMELLALYQQKHDAIVDKNRQLDDLVFDAGHWWLDAAPLADALQQVRAFIDNVDRNFGEHAPAWRQIQSAEHRAERKRQIVEALMTYRAERDAWDSLF